MNAWNKILMILTLLFFVAVNTSFYWSDEGALGFLGYILLYFLFFIFLIVLLVQIGLLFYGKFQNKPMIFTTALLAVVLICTYYKPLGLLKHETIEERALLVARQTGVANCATTMRLLDNNRLSIKSICFGITKTGGTYRTSMDTLFLMSNDKEYKFQFGIVKLDSIPHDSRKGILYLYRSHSDSFSYPMVITENRLFK